MMDCDYPYDTHETSHAHTYLTRPLLDILASGPVPERLLDAGCAFTQM